MHLRSKFCVSCFSEGAGGDAFLPTMTVWPAATMETDHLAAGPGISMRRLFPAARDRRSKQSLLEER